MDWSRAKSIILFLLLAFNIFLLTEVYGYTRGQGIPAETIRNTLKILESRGVKLECPIPGYDTNIPKLEINNTGPDKIRLAGKLLGGGYRNGDTAGTYVSGSKKAAFEGAQMLKYCDNAPADTVDVVHTRSLEKYVRNFLEDKGLADSSYILDESIVNNDGSFTMTYLEKYKGYLVYGNYAKIVVTDKGISGLEMHRRYITGFSAARTADVAAAYQVLLANFEQSDVIITGIDLGYADAGVRDIADAKPTELLPAWRVRIKGASGPRYFSAIDGKEIRND